MKYEISYGTRAAAVPLDAIEKIESINAYRLLILMCSDPAMCEVNNLKNAAEYLHITEESAAAAADELVLAKLLKEDFRCKEYSGKEIEEITVSNPEIRGMLDECANICGLASFSTVDRNRVISLVDELKMEPEAVILLYSFLNETYLFSGKKVTPSAALKRAYRIKIKTSAEMGKYIEDEKEKSAFYVKLRKMLGIGTRELTTEERNCFDGWKNELCCMYDMIHYAYETAIHNIGGDAKTISVIKYMDSVLRSWKAKGIEDVPSAEKEKNEHKKAADTQKKTYDGMIHSFDNDDFFKAALQSSFSSIEDELKG